MIASSQTSELAEIAEKLKAPFPQHQLSWRVMKKPKSGFVTIAPYVKRPIVENRLDNIVGLFNWRVEFSPWMGSGTICKIGIRIPGEEDWIWREDGAGTVENISGGKTESESNSMKGSMTSAFNRAAKTWGIGRYIEFIKSERVQVHGQYTPGALMSWADNKTFWFKPFDLPLWALPKVEK